MRAWENRRRKLLSAGSHITASPSQLGPRTRICCGDRLGTDASPYGRPRAAERLPNIGFARQPLDSKPRGPPAAVIPTEMGSNLGRVFFGGQDEIRLESG